MLEYHWVPKWIDTNKLAAHGYYLHFLEKVLNFNQKHTMVFMTWHKNLCQRLWLNNKGTIKKSKEKMKEKPELYYEDNKSCKN